MFFRKQHVLQFVDIAPGETIELSETTPNVLKLVIRRPYAGENPKATGSECIGVVHTEESVSEETRRQFELPGDPRPAVVEIRRRVSQRLHAYVLRSFRILKWRTGDVERESPIKGTEPLNWSDDGLTWKAIHAPPGAAEWVAQIPPLRTSNDVLKSLEGLMKSGLDEPFAHELLREAWSLRRVSPRSSFLIGIAAAEVGFKTFVGVLVPDAKWLAFNSPTSPLDKMLGKYLPELPVRVNLAGPPSIPAALRKTLSEGVELRNKIAHAGAEPPSVKALEEMLWAVHNLLYILDWYSGYKWALDCIGRKASDFESGIEEK